MSVKSILEVEVSSAEFARYKEMFDQYEEQLKKQPSLWAAVAKQHKQLQQQMQHTAEAMNDEHEKLADVEKTNKENEKRLQHSQGLWDSMAKSSGSFAKNITSTSSFLSKWGTLIFSGVIGGAYLGIDRATHDAASNRQQSMGLGVSIGELKAFNTNFARFGDTGSVLNSVNAMETDVTQRKPWYALGLGNMTGNTVKDAIAFLEAERKFAQRTPLGLLGPMATAYGLPSSAEQLRLMGGTGDAESAKMEKGAAADIGRMNIPGSGALQNLDTMFGRNFAAVASAFQTQLARAAPVIGTFSDAIATAATGDITNFGNFLSTIKKDVMHGGLAGPVVDFFQQFVDGWKQQLGLIPATPGPPGSGLPFPALLPAIKSGANWLAPTKESITASPQAYMDYLSRRDMVAGLPKGFLEAIFQTESSGNLHPPDSAKHAMGPFQFLKNTATSLGIDPYDPVQAAAGAEKYIRALIEEFRGDIEKALAAYNWGPGHMEELLKLHPNDWKKFLPKETSNYVRKIEVKVDNNTGGSATVAANQLAH